MSSCDHAGLEPEIFFDIIYEEDRYHLISPRKFLLTDGAERLQRLQLPDLQSFGLRPEVVLVFLVEFHGLLMILGDLDTELAFDRSTIRVQLSLRYHTTHLLLAVSEDTMQSVNVCTNSPGDSIAHASATYDRRPT